jgi:hypothetical protein
MNNYIPAYNIDLLPVLIALVLLSTVMLWIAIKNYKNLAAMIVIIPLTIFSGWTVYTTIDKLLGYPVVENFTEQSIYLFHTEGLDNDWIFVWIFKSTDTRPKAIMVPNTKNNKDALEEAKERSQGGGIPQVIRSKENAKGQTVGGELERYDFQMNNIQNLKDNEPQPTEPQSNNTRHIRNPTYPTSTPPNNRPDGGATFTGFEYTGPAIIGENTFEKSQKPQIRKIIPSGK